MVMNDSMVVTAVVLENRVKLCSSISLSIFLEFLQELRHATSLLTTILVKNLVRNNGNIVLNLVSGANLCARTELIYPGN